MAILSQGTLFQYSANGSAFTTLAGVFEADAPKRTVKRIDLADLSSTVELPIAGLAKVDDISIKVYHSIAAVTALVALASTIYYYKLTFPDSTTITWQGYLQDMESKITANKEIEWGAKITPTTDIVITPG